MQEKKEEKEEEQEIWAWKWNGPIYWLAKGTFTIPRPWNVFG